MKRMTGVIVVAVALLALVVDKATAQVELLDNWNWVPTETGSQPWQDNANWVESGFPDNPGYVDPDPSVISNSTGANLAVPLGSNLTVNIQNPSVTVAALRLGGTAGLVTTDVAGPGTLVFENYEQNNNTDPDNPIYAFNRGRALIVSGGVAGATNTISSPILINRENLDVGTDGTNASTNSLTLSGNITVAGGAADSTTMPTLSSFLPEGQQLIITGTLTMPDNNPHTAPDPIAFDFGLNASGNDAQGARGTIVVSGTGTLAGDGHIRIGGPTMLLTANSISNRVHASGNITLGHDMSLGTAQLISDGATFMSTDDARNIANNMGMPNVFNIAGDHSIEFSGDLQMTNSRSWNNFLPLGKQLVLSGTQYIEDEEGASGMRAHYDLHEYGIGGSGTTRITGVVANHATEPATNRGAISKRGSGALFMQGSQTSDGQGGFNNVEYTGYTEVHGGTLHLATINDINTNSSGLPRGPVVSRAGGIGLENGTLTGPDSSTFLSLFNNRTNAFTWLVGAVPSSGGGFQLFADDMQSFGAYDHGGLMLATNEYSQNVDFSSAALANVRDMSLAARERGSTTQYTGTLTPYQNTYRLGGGGGTLELPGQNALTGSRSLVATNGGDTSSAQGVGRVLLSNTNNYSGTTRIEGEWLTVGNLGATAHLGTTLAVTSLANGGQVSSIGNASSAASNLVMQGGTLQYTGSSNASTDRLFTLGTHGGGIDASGTGTVSFTNTGAVDIGFAAPRNGDTVGNSWAPTERSTNQNNWVIDINDTSDLVPGMTISGQGIVPDPEDDDDVVTIIEISSPTRVRISDGGYRDLPATAYNNTPLTFGTVDRDFVLSGTNTGNNTFAPLIADSETTGDINVVKEGAGKWIVTNPANDWSGDTIVEAGTLSITSAFLNDDADVQLFSDAVFDLNFSGSDTIASLFFDDIEQVPGTWGSLTSSAANKRDWFTGNGILNVTEGLIVALAGDFNGDGVVNIADYTRWRDNLGGMDDLSGNGDETGGSAGIVDAADYALWKGNFGMTAAASSSLSVANAAIPEPATMVVLLLGVVPLAHRLRKRA